MCTSVRAYNPIFLRPTFFISSPVVFAHPCIFLCLFRSLRAALHTLTCGITFSPARLPDCLLCLPACLPACTVSR